MTSRVATLDLGSNSSLCLISDLLPDGTARQVEDNARVTGLGRGLSPAGLHPDARARTREALAFFRTRLDAHQVTAVRAVATAAMRDAVDGRAFAAELTRDFGIPVDVISGEREAELTYLAVVRTVQTDGTVAVIDIGGRSTELMHGTTHQLAHRRSLSLGSVSGTEGFLTGDPVDPASVARLAAHAAQLLEEIPRPPAGALGVGVASTVTTFAALSLAMAQYDGRRIHGLTLTRETLETQLARLTGLTVAERCLLPGLDAKRADVILAGGVILLACLKRLDLTGLTVSDHGLRHGVLYDWKPEVRRIYFAEE